MEGGRKEVDEEEDAALVEDEEEDDGAIGGSVDGVVDEGVVKLIVMLLFASAAVVVLLGLEFEFVSPLSCTVPDADDGCCGGRFPVCMISMKPFGSPMLGKASIPPIPIGRIGSEEESVDEESVRRRFDGGSESPTEEGAG